MGERGYVVTFRQIDPLYTLDLRDPTAPKVVGELKIPGYSAYLHPVGENLLLGRRARGQRGQGVAVRRREHGRAARGRAAAVRPNGSSAVEFEPHAFLYWAPKSLAVLPLQTYQPEFTGAAGVRIAPNALTEVGRVVHHSAARGDDAPIERSLVIGDKLYTLSWLGLASSNLDTLGGAHGFTRAFKEGRRGARRRGVPGAAAMRVAAV